MGKFKDSPLAQFITPAISTTEPPPTHEKGRVTPQEKEARKKRAKANAKYINTPPAVYRAKDDRTTPRTRRVQLLFRPALYNEIIAIAHSKGQSLNNCIEDILTAYLEQKKGE